MKIQIRARKIKVSKALRAHLELRLGFALSRFGERIGPVTVELSKVDDRYNWAEIHCRIAVGLRGSVEVRETDADLLAAVNRAVRRVARSVAQTIEQEQKRTEGPLRPSGGKRTKASSSSPPNTKCEVVEQRRRQLERRLRSAARRKLTPPRRA